MRNPHAGEPFPDDDRAIAAALDGVNVPALLCSLVHMTGDPSWVRDRALPAMPSVADYQGGLTDHQQADIRRRALPVVVGYRDAGCEPRALSDDILLEMMSFLAGQPVDGRLAEMFFEDMQFGGSDSRAVTWGDDIPADVRAASHRLTQLQPGPSEIGAGSWSPMIR